MATNRGIPISNYRKKKTKATNDLTQIKHAPSQKRRRKILNASDRDPYNHCKCMSIEGLKR